MSINAVESISEDIIAYYCLARNVPECDEVKIIDYKLFPVKNIYFTARVKVAALKDKKLLKHIQKYLMSRLILKKKTRMSVRFCTRWWKFLQ